MTKFKFGDRIRWKRHRALFLSYHTKPKLDTPHCEIAFGGYIDLFEGVSKERMHVNQMEVVPVSEVKKGWKA